jgi:hypothetical protein
MDSWGDHCSPGHYGRDRVLRVLFYLGPPQLGEGALNLRTSNPLPAANTRWLFCFRWPGEIGGSLTSSELGSPASVAEGGR